MKLSVLFVAVIGFALCGCGGQQNKLEAHRVQERLETNDKIDDTDHYYDSYWFLALESGDATIGLESEQFNPYMLIYDDTGAKVAEDDDSGLNDDAKATIRVTFGHRYRIICSSKDPNETGEYRLKTSNNLQYDSTINRGIEAQIKRK